MSSAIDWRRLKVSSSVSPQQLKRSSWPNKNPISFHKWLKASNCSLVPTIPNLSGIKMLKPMNRNWVIDMSFWEMIPMWALVDFRLETTCIRRTFSREFQALRKIIQKITSWEPLKIYLRWSRFDWIAVPSQKVKKVCLKSAIRQRHCWWLLCEQQHLNDRFRCSDGNQTKTQSTNKCIDIQKNESLGTLKE